MSRRAAKSARLVRSHPAAWAYFIRPELSRRHRNLESREGIGDRAQVLEEREEAGVSESATAGEESL
jgi:hypothetical protein